MALNYSFAGKRILITGGTRGIGRELVKFFQDDGAHVFTIGTNPELVKKLMEEFPKVTAGVADLNDWQKTRQVVESFGPFDCLVNNAAMVVPEGFMDVTEDAAKLQFNINVGGVINVSQVVAKGMMERGSGGSIINISSVNGRKHCPSSAVYGATKAAVESLTRTMAKELGPHNICVNCIILGVVDGGMVDFASYGKEILEYFESIRKKLIVQRFIEMKEVSLLVAFLLSPLSSMMVGETYVLDGGYLNG